MRMNREAHIFVSLRPQLLGIAYRMLGSRADAEDVLHDAWLRWSATDMEKIRSAEAWLKTAVTRLSIDRLRKAKLERETYAGPWLPEPLSDAELTSPEFALERDDDISIAFLTLLESLSPEERAVFVLHDILDDDYVDVAETVGKSQAACRQLVHRAREKLTSKRRRYPVDDATRTRMLEKFIEAASRGDRAEIMKVFAADAIMISDGGGKAIALRRPLLGAERISWLWFAVSRRADLRAERRFIRVNGEPALASFYNGKLHSVAVIETDGERIHALYTIANPDKLAAFRDLVTERRADTSLG
jgi:RNA polymerase sigma-70 factor, ECF subfamily